MFVTTVCPHYNAVFGVHDIELRGMFYSMCCSICHQGGGGLAINELDAAVCALHHPYVEFNGTWC